MPPEFEEFLSKWQVLAKSTGGLPTRKQITIGEFHAFLPNMVIARWDTKIWLPEIKYCGTRLDELLKRDIRSAPAKAVLQPGPHMETHLEIAKAVIKDRMGAEVEAEISVGPKKSIIVSQLRLPLADEDGKGVIMSYFLLPDISPHEAIDGYIKFTEMRYKVIELGQFETCEGVASTGTPG